MTEEKKYEILATNVIASRPPNVVDCCAAPAIGANYYRVAKPSKLFKLMGEPLFITSINFRKNNILQTWGIFDKSHPI